MRTGLLVGVAVVVLLLVGALTGIISTKTEHSSGQVTGSYLCLELDSQEVCVFAPRGFVDISFGLGMRHIDSTITEGPDILNPFHNE